MEEKKRGKGRPTKLTAEVQQKIVTAIKGGNYRQVAGRWAGVCPDTMTNWMNRGEEEKTGIYADFFRAITEAEHEAEIFAATSIYTNGKSEVDHFKWWLERKCHERWGRKDRKELVGAGGGPIQIKETIKTEVSKLTMEELLALKKLQERLAGEGSSA